MHEKLLLVFLNFLGCKVGLYWFGPVWPSLFYGFGTRDLSNDHYYFILSHPMCGALKSHGQPFLWISGNHLELSGLW